MQNVTTVLQKILKFGILVLFIFLFQNGGCEKVVSVSLPDLPPPNGYLFIDSYPKGAHIYLNGKARRRATPDSITWLKTGTDTITLKKELYRDTTFTASVVEGKKFNVFIDYTKNPLMRGKIYCSSSPQKASIFINDSSTGLKTPTTITGLLPGYYNITYKIENHRDITSSVTIKSNSLSSLYSILVDTTVWRDFNTDNSGISTNELSCISIDNNNKIWIGTLNNGITILDGNQWFNYHFGGTRLPSNKIYSITTSRSDNKKWVGTESGLAEYYGDGSNDINVYKAPFYPIGTVRGVAAKNDGSLAIATDAYVVIWPKGGLMKPSYPTRSSSEDYLIDNIAFDKNSHIWFGTKKAGVAQSLGDVWELYTSPSSDIISNQITALTADNFGTIWIGHPGGYALANGLNYYDGAWQSLYILPDASSVNSLFFDKKNRLWVGTTKGLLEKDGSVTTLYNYDNTGLNITNVSGVAEDLDGNIWIITFESGLFRLKQP